MLSQTVFFSDCLYFKFNKASVTRTLMDLDLSILCIRHVGSVDEALLSDLSEFPVPPEFPGIPAVPSQDQAISSEKENHYLVVPKIPISM